MANTYCQLYIQTVFAVKYRNAIIDKTWKDQLCAVIGNLINETGCKCIIVNGVADHMHCFFGLKPSISISDVMRNVKAKSSKWINESGFLTNKFEWQSGFGAFSYNHVDLNSIFSYVQNQEEHHQKKSFKEEYRDLLKSFSIEYNEAYLFEELI